MTGESRNRLGAVLLAGLLVFGPRLQVLDLHVVAAIVSALGGLLVLARGRSRHSGSVRLLVTGLLPAFGWSLAIVQLRGSDDFTLPYVVAIGGVYCLASLGVLSLYESVYAERGGSALIRHVVAWGAVNGAVAISSVFSPWVRRAIQSSFDVGFNEVWVDVGYRALDLSLGGGTNASVTFAGVFLVGLVVPEVRRRGTLWVPLCVVGLASVLSGRTGAVILALGVTVLVVGWGVRRRRLVGGTGRRGHGAQASPLGSKQGKLAAAGVGGALVSVILVSAVSSTVNPVEQLGDVLVPYALEDRQAPVGGQRGGGPSVLGSRVLGFILEDMYFLPEGGDDLLVGTGTMGRDEAEGYVASDVGYVRVIFASGLVGAALLYGFFVVSGLRAYRPPRSWASQAAAGYICVVLVANLKEAFLFPRGGGVLLFILLLVALAETQGGRSGVARTRGVAAKWASVRR